MDELKERIIAFVDSGKRKSVDRKMIAAGLGFTKAGELIALGKALDDLEAEYVLFRGERNVYKTRRQAQMIPGVLHISRRGTGYIDQTDGPSILIDAEFQKGALDGDLVLAHISGVDQERQKVYGTVYAILEHRTSFLVGTLSYHGRSVRFIPDSEKLKERTIVMHFPQGFVAEDDLKVVGRIVSFESPLVLEWQKTLGHRQDPGVDITSILLEHHIVSEYRSASLEEAAACGTKVREEELVGRVDLSGVQIVTIDGEDARDFDDAVSVERDGSGWRLRVSIADVSHYVKAGSSLDQEAFQRGCSTYVPDRVVSMLPKELSNGICSLNPHVVRLTNTCDMHIEADGTIRSCRLYASWIRSAARLTYTEVNRFLEQDAEMLQQYADFNDLLINLRDCADAIRLARAKKGAVDFDTMQAQIICDEAGHPTAVNVDRRGHAERMIEDCMIAANVSVARFMDEHKIPCVYRIHEQPTEKRLREFARFAAVMGVPFSIKGKVTPLRIQQYLKAAESEPAYPLLVSQMLRCMQKACYEAEDRGHFGLGEESYLHFTSPIRRYPDLLVHRMLRKYYYEKCLSVAPEDQAIVREASVQSSMQERISADAEFACMDMKKAEYMANQVGAVFIGTIVTVTAHGFYVALDNTVEGMVGMQALQDDYYELDEERLCLVGAKKHAIYQVGQRVEVRVLGADKEKQTVDFGLVSMEKKTERFASRRPASQKSVSFAHRGHTDRRPSFHKTHKVKKEDGSHEGRRRPAAFSKDMKKEKGTYKKTEHAHGGSVRRLNRPVHAVKGKKYGGKGTH